MTADALPAGAPTPEPQPCENTDRELWRERDGDFYAPSIHVTASGGIGINVGGSVVVMPVQAWHRLAAPASGLRSRQTRDEDGQRASVAYAHIAPPITAEDLDFVAAHIPDAWGRPLTRAQFDAERERLAAIVSALRSHFFPTATLTTSQSGALSSSSGQGAE